MKDFGLSKYVEQLCGELQDEVKPAFTNLPLEKKTKVLLAICQEAGQRDNPLNLNIKEVAQRGGFAIGSLYQYFGNRRSMMHFFLTFLRRYMEEVMKEAYGVLSEYPLPQALEYYCQGAALWGKEERELAYVFYKGAYCGGAELTEALIKPLAVIFHQGLEKLLILAQERQEIRKHLDTTFLAGWIYRSLIPFSDSQIYQDLDKYFFPIQEQKEDIKKMIDQFMILMAPGGMA